MAKSAKEVYFKLINDLENELEIDKDIPKMKTSMKDPQFGGFRTGELSRAKTCRELTEMMERKGVIGAGNLVKLEELMIMIENLSAAKVVSEAEAQFKEVPRARKDAAKLSERHPYSLARTTSTEDASSFKNDDNQRLANAYNMMPGTGKPYVILVYNTISQAESPEHEEEENSRKKDAENLRNIFEAMKADIVPCENCTKQKLFKILEYKMVGDFECNNYTALFIILISHGDQKGIQMIKDSSNSEDVFVTVEQIEERITSEKLPQMKGKPKIILVQACRKSAKSATRHDGITEQDAVVHHEYVPHVPANADILIAHATSKLCLAYRNADEGSWYISKFCEIVKKYCDHDHLLELLTTLNKELAEKVEETEDGSKLNQMPTFLSTLTKKLYLPYPKLPNVPT